MEASIRLHPTRLTSHGLKILRASDLQVATGKVLRIPGETVEDFTARAKDPLRELLTRSEVDEAAAVTCLFVWGELASNFQKYTRGAWLRYYFDTTASRVKMVSVYQTERFELVRPAPDPLAEDGRGLFLMRRLADLTGYFNGGEAHLSMMVARQE